MELEAGSTIGRLGAATMPEVRLSKLEFAAGPSVGDEALGIEMSTVLILVGFKRQESTGGKGWSNTYTSMAS